MAWHSNVSDMATYWSHDLPTMSKRVNKSVTSSELIALASSIFSEGQKAMTVADLPMPWGIEIEPRRAWSACLGSMPRWATAFTVWSNLTFNQNL